MTRVAVYFSGHLRNLSDNWANYKRVFSYPDIEFDFFFTLWRKNHITTSESWKHSNQHGKTLVEIRDITEEDIYSICPNAKRVEILDEPIFDKKYDGFFKNIIPQTYGIYKSFGNLPKDYDYYVRMRTDLYFFRGVNWRDALGECVISKTVHFNLPNYPDSDLFNDFFWVGNYETNRYLANLYMDIVNYDSTQITERLFTRHMRASTIVPRQYPFEFVLERRTRGFDGLPETGPYTQRRKEEGDFV